MKMQCNSITKAFRCCNGRTYLLALRTKDATILMTYGANDEVGPYYYLQHGCIYVCCCFVFVYANPFMSQVKLASVLNKCKRQTDNTKYV